MPAARGRRAVARRRPIARRGRLLDDRGAPRASSCARRGCMWLTMFPSVETAKRLAAVALDPATPHAGARAGDRGRSAIASCARCIRRTQWPAPTRCRSPTRRSSSSPMRRPRPGKITSEQLPHRAAPRRSGRAPPPCSRVRPGCGARRSSASRRRRSRACCSSVSTTSRRSTGCARMRLVGGDARRGGACRCCSRARRGAPIDEKLEMLFLIDHARGRGASSPLLEDALRGHEVRRPAAAAREVAPRRTPASCRRCAACASRGRPR